MFDDYDIVENIVIHENVSASDKKRIINIFRQLNVDYNDLF